MEQRRYKVTKVLVFAVIACFTMGMDLNPVDGSDSMVFSMESRDSCVDFVYHQYDRAVDQRASKKFPIESVKEEMHRQGVLVNIESVEKNIYSEIETLPEGEARESEKKKLFNMIKELQETEVSFAMPLQAYSQFIKNYHMEYSILGVDLCILSSYTLISAMVEKGLTFIKNLNSILTGKEEYYDGLADIVMARAREHILEVGPLHVWFTLQYNFIDMLSKRYLQSGTAKQQQFFKTNMDIIKSTSANSIQDILISPIQRFPRYQMLIMDIMRSSCRIGEANFDVLNPLAESLISYKGTLEYEFQMFFARNRFTVNQGKGLYLYVLPSWNYIAFGHIPLKEKQGLIRSLSKSKTYTTPEHETVEYKGKRISRKYIYIAKVNGPVVRIKRTIGEKDEVDIFFENENLATYFTEEFNRRRKDVEPSEEEVSNTVRRELTKKSLERLTK